MLNVYDTLATGPTTIYRKQDISVERCGEVISIYKNNSLIMRSYQPNKVNGVFIMKIVDKLLK